jgi:hypothetical protein
MTLRQLGQRLLGLRPAACSGTSAFAAAGASLTHASAALGGLAAPQPQPVASSSGRGAPAGPWCWEQQHGYAVDARRRAHLPSRKPAIKKPNPHQWHFCDINYDPMTPLPLSRVPPYAPPKAHEKDYREVMLANMPARRTRRCAPARPPHPHHHHHHHHHHQTHQPLRLLPGQAPTLPVAQLAQPGAAAPPEPRSAGACCACGTPAATARQLARARPGSIPSLIVWVVGLGGGR